MTGLLLRVPAEDHRALCTHDLTGTLDPTDPPTKGDVIIAMDLRAPGHDRVWEPGACPRHPAANLADAVPFSQLTWTSAQRITADVPERH
ncbi:hypothetical protein GCM10022226_03920 [Sphaerisporangium flaviroseum]|uniref:Uncharacterized protein n=1 Tax=Sphaerisporangium flaviroseum TaxID=509199 RepID=A0ABP7HC27_9ACTN